MKELNWRPLVLLLGGILIFGGINAFMQSLNALVQGVSLGIWTLFNLLPHLPTSLYSLVSKGITEAWILTNVVWIDTILLNIATFIPSIIIFFISKNGLKLTTTISTLISIIILLFILELFSLISFLIVLGVAIIVAIIL